MFGQERISSGPGLHIPTKVMALLFLTILDMYQGISDHQGAQRWSSDSPDRQGLKIEKEVRWQPVRIFGGRPQNNGKNGPTMEWAGRASYTCRLYRLRLLRLGCSSAYLGKYGVKANCSRQDISGATQSGIIREGRGLGAVYVGVPNLDEGGASATNGLSGSVIVRKCPP